MSVSVFVSFTGNWQLLFSPFTLGVIAVYLQSAWSLCRCWVITMFSGTASLLPFSVSLWLIYGKMVLNKILLFQSLIRNSLNAATFHACSRFIRFPWTFIFHCHYIRPFVKIKWMNLLICLLNTKTRVDKILINFRKKWRTIYRHVESTTPALQKTV